MAVALVAVVGVVAAVVLARGGPPGLEARWRLHAGGVVVGAPIVAGPTIFVATRSGELVAVDADTGEGRWRLESGERVLGAPVAAGGLVFLATEVIGSGAGHVFGVDARTGTEQWRVVIDAPFAGRVAVSDGIVFVSA
ncbi:MAG: PQQ-binding-like beta-propeller repeat protein, partial [Actinomycetota bacterium]|nr:PQQ-binding-like beta-propeller repeat protein [Actinomycetota bacterium]